MGLDRDAEIRQVATGIADGEATAAVEVARVATVVAPAETGLDVVVALGRRSHRPASVSSRLGVPVQNAMLFTSGHDRVLI
jgi:hypothetical protein